jgi:hypothetical protein
LTKYISKFGLDFYQHKDKQQISQLELIIQQIDLSEFSDLKVEMQATVCSNDPHKNNNIFLLKWIYHQKNKLEIIHSKPFFAKIIEWAFNCLNTISLNQNFVSFTNKGTYLNYFRQIIENLDSLKLIVLMAKHPIVISLLEEEKKDFIKNFTHSKNNLSRLAIQWNILTPDIISYLYPSYLYPLSFPIKKVNLLEKPETFHITVVDDLLFGHIHGNMWLRGTQWEGNNFINTLGYIFDLSFPKMLFPANTVLQHALFINYALHTCNDSSIDIEYVYANNIAEPIIKLFKETGYVVVPAGWSDGYGSGHAIICVLYKIESDYYCMIFNTGDGIQYHVKQEIEGRELFFNSKVFKVNDPTILTPLLVELLIPNLKANIQYGADSIYEKILPAFTSYMVEITETALLTKLGSILIEPQFSGVCSWAVVETWLQSNLILAGNQHKWPEIIKKIKCQSYLDYLANFMVKQSDIGKISLFNHARENLQAILTPKEMELLPIHDSCLVATLPLQEQKTVEVFTSQQSSIFEQQQKLIEVLTSGLVKTNVLVEEKFSEASLITLSTRSLTKFLSLSIEAHLDSNIWLQFNNICQTLMQQSQFDKVMYYIENWLSKIDFSQHPPLPENKFI